MAISRLVTPEGHVSMDQQASMNRQESKDRSYNSKIAESISVAFARIGDTALMVDPHCTTPHFSIAGVSSGFCTTTGYTPNDVVGASLTLLFENAPVGMISKSGLKNLQDYCRLCNSKDVDHIAETSIVQPIVCQDGSHFQGAFLAGLCEFRCRAYVLLVVKKKVQHQGKAAEEHETLRKAFLRIRSGLNGYNKEENYHSQSSFGSTNAGTPFPSWHGSESAGVVAKEKAFKSRRPRMEHRMTRRGHRRAKALERLEAAQLPAFAFFAQRLDVNCVLSREGHAATRRESSELQKGCLVYSDRCMKMSYEGLEFSVRVDAIEQKWKGLPILGFTQRKPTDTSDLYPSIGMYQGSSVLVGMEGKAFARDQYPHFVVGFKRPTQEQVRVWQPNATFQCPQLTVGDTLRCVYTRVGRIQLWMNTEKIIDFDSERQLDPSAEYYAVVDVCFNATSLTVLPPYQAPPCKLKLTSELLGSLTSKSGYGEYEDKRVLSMDTLPSMSGEGSLSSDSVSVALDEKLVHPSSLKQSFFTPVTEAVPSYCRDGVVRTGQSPLERPSSIVQDKLSDGVVHAGQGPLGRPGAIVHDELSDFTCTPRRTAQYQNTVQAVGVARPHALPAEHGNGWLIHPLACSTIPDLGDLFNSGSKGEEWRRSMAFRSAFAIAVFGSVGMYVCIARRASKMA
jgi:hypothetical protein